jgi:hypothetical protein
MKQRPFLLPAFCGFLLCCFSHLCWAERHETVILSYDKSETFPAISGNAWENIWGDLSGNSNIGRWILQNHAAVTREIFLKQGEIAHVVKYSSRLRTGHEPSVYTDSFYGPSLAYMEIDREGFDYNESISLGGLSSYMGLSSSLGVNTKRYNESGYTSNYYLYQLMSTGYNVPRGFQKVGKGDLIHGPCKIKIYFFPALWRGKTSYKDDRNYTVTAQNSSPWVKGLGGFEYGPSEGYVVFKIFGSPSDTSVGATVGGSGSGGAVSGKNYVTVIPENSPKNVRIVLEQSTDLINWSAANQGVFSPSTTRRFFRVRSEEE